HSHVGAGTRACTFKISGFSHARPTGSFVHIEFVSGWILNGYTLGGTLHFSTCADRIDREADNSGEHTGRKHMRTYLRYFGGSNLHRLSLLSPNGSSAHIFDVGDIVPQPARFTGWHPQATTGCVLSRMVPASS